MNLAYIKNVLEAEVLCGQDYLDTEIKIRINVDVDQQQSNTG